MHKVSVVASLFAAVAAAGCAGAGASTKSAKQDQVASVDETRTSRTGVCAVADATGPMGVASSVKACARASGDGAVIYSEFTSASGERWNPGNWRLVLTAPDGGVLLDTTFKPTAASTVSDTACMRTSNCVRYGQSSRELSAPWKAGTYRFRYTYLPELQPVELTITLQ